MNENFSYFLAIIIIMFPVGLVIEYAMSKSKRLIQLDKLMVVASSTSKSERLPYEFLEGEIKSKIELVCTRLSNNYRIIVGIQGILLAFVISSGKILLVFSSWYFVIWCGLILASIIRSAKYSVALTDIQKHKESM